jgi:hypothetical protein
LGLAPLAAIPIVYFTRVALKKRKQAPWLLPAANLILIIAAMLTGIAAMLTGITADLTGITAMLRSIACRK